MKKGNIILSRSNFFHYVLIVVNTNHWHFFIFNVYIQLIIIMKMKGTRKRSIICFQDENIIGRSTTFYNRKRQILAFVHALNQSSVTLWACKQRRYATWCIRSWPEIIAMSQERGSPRIQFAREKNRWTSYYWCTPGIRISPLIPISRQLLYHLIRELTPSNCECVINILGTCVPRVRNVA